MPEIEQDQRMKILASRFPLKMVKWLPPGSPLETWNDHFEKMKKQYIQSFYAKIYLALNDLDQKITRKMEAEGQSFDAEEDQKLNSLLAVFRYRTPIIRQWRNTLGVFEDSVEVFAGQDPRQFVYLDDIRKAWAYFFCPDHP